MNSQKIIEYGKGNPGAMRFIAEIIKYTKEDPKPFFDAIEKDKTLRGTNSYILCSDLCDGDIDKVIYLCHNCPTEILSDACSRQDYSGRSLVSDYMLKEK